MLTRVVVGVALAVMTSGCSHSSNPESPVAPSQVRITGVVTLVSGAPESLAEVSAGLGPPSWKVFSRDTTSAQGRYEVTVPLVTDTIYVLGVQLNTPARYHPAGVLYGWVKLVPVRDTVVDVPLLYLEPQ
jgi:hypothetical protein